VKLVNYVEFKSKPPFGHFVYIALQLTRQNCSSNKVALANNRWRQDILKFFKS